MNYIIEEPKSTRIIKNCDVVVAGGGVAGIAAALAAARNGSKVILIEKQCGLGGLATLGLITIYLPLCDGHGNQVIYGLGEELLKLSVKYGYEGRYPKPWFENGTKEEKEKHRYLIQFNAQLFALAAEELLLEEGVEIIYDTRITSVHKTKDSIDAVLIDNKQGHMAIMTKTVIDATGDADVCMFAGENTTVNDKNVLAVWYYYVGKEGLKLRRYPYAWSKPKFDPNHRFYNGVLTDDVSSMIIDGHKEIIHDVIKEREKFEDSTIMPVTIPNVPEFRMTRRLVGAYEMEEAEVHKEFYDSVGMTGDWRKKGPAFNIPYRTLYGNKVKNLITCGRCISVKDDLWDVTRVIPTCAVTGEAAGTAAALLAMDNLESFAELDVNKLQNQLKKQGVKINEDFQKLQ
jgi:hypothetical protein